MHKMSTSFTASTNMLKGVGLTHKAGWISITARRCSIKYVFTRSSIVVSILTKEMSKEIITL
jgi:hypothetical protein